MKILIVEDDPLCRDAIENFLVTQMNLSAVIAENADSALTLFKETPFSIVISDIRMPGMSGMDMLEKIREHPEGKNTDVILISGHADLDTAVQALRLGAYDLLRKPLNIRELAAVIKRSLDHQALIHENEGLKTSLNKAKKKKVKLESVLEDVQKNFLSDVTGIGKAVFFNKKMLELAKTAEKLHEEPSARVIVQGETGTGKEVIVQLIHHGKETSKKPLVTVNCSAISPTLFESELFGYDSGSFTGANREGKIGKMELASGGTLFLDEIGELPLDMQPKLLRVLEENEFYRVGGNKKVRLNTRVICATNRDLEKLVRAGKFRDDLFYRLNVAKIRMPALRERKDEIPMLAQVFLEKYSGKMRKSFKIITMDAVKILQKYDWPGNVRELDHAIERIVLLFDDVELKPEHLGSIESLSGYSEISSSDVLKPGRVVLPDEGFDMKALEHEIVHKALEKFNGNKTKVAEYLKLTRSALRSRLKPD